MNTIIDPGSTIPAFQKGHAHEEWLNVKDSIVPMTATNDDRSEGLYLAFVNLSEINEGYGERCRDPKPRPRPVPVCMYMCNEPSDWPPLERPGKTDKPEKPRKK